jgi:SAM-dependent methyltransferase
LFQVSGTTATLFGKGTTYADPQKVDADFAYQGEYQGELQVDGQAVKAGMQVVAQGEGNFLVVGYMGGLPGAGWDGQTPERAMAKVIEGQIKANGQQASAVIRDGVATIVDSDGQKLGTLTKIERTSPTLGQAPPANATVLFDGTSADAWEGGRMTDDKLLLQGVTSKAKFGDQRLHIEFRLPYEPEDRGQERGNSGIYLQGRYEVQMLDSFGLEGRDNEAGGIYEIASPTVNMCYPPLSWQTYDIEFHAAKYDAQGKLESHPWMTVWHNGVKVQDQVQLPRATRAAPNSPGPEDGPIYLQDHGNPVVYRNIWVAPLAEEKASVKPGINDNFLDPALKIEEWVERFEGESREVFTAREAVLQVIGLRAGQRIADVGAGTGLYTRLFARKVGPEGWVYAVDISPKFVQYITESSQKLDLNNITAVLCDADSVTLAPGSVDVVFTCDTYHHFEYPAGTVSSIYRALKPGGTFVVVDFERIPGVSREWTLNHVRAGKEEVQREIEAVGFRLDEDVKIDGFQENYLLRFKKPE